MLLTTNAGKVVTPFSSINSTYSLTHPLTFSTTHLLFSTLQLSAGPHLARLFFRKLISDAQSFSSNKKVTFFQNFYRKLSVTSNFFKQNRQKQPPSHTKVFNLNFLFLKKYNKGLLLWGAQQTWWGELMRGIQEF